MLNFQKLGAFVSAVKEYFEKSEISFCDLSIGAKYMWRDEYVIDFAIFNDTLIIKEDGPSYKDNFYYPMGKDIAGALNEIENYCREKFIPLCFCCIDKEHAKILKDRYHEVKIFNDRDWDDYIYCAVAFKTYSGKKYNGQRNHVNKFKKTYPNYNFVVMKDSDLPRIKKFLLDYENATEFSADSKDEQEKVLDYVEHALELEQVGGFIEVDGKIVALSVGERVGDTLIVHIEKGLKEYNGVYPTMAQEFARAFAHEGIKYINREEDCGDEGLRTSKMQYKPIEIKEKIAVHVNTLWEKLRVPVCIKTERLEIGDLKESDKSAYQKLYLDDQLNKWWGYDYREDLGDNQPTPDYFFNFQNALKEKKEEYALAVRKDGELVGELVLHNFDYFGGIEMGFRFFSECQGKGYATESAGALKKFVIEELGATTVKSRCFKQNTPSRRLIERLGLVLTSEDQTHYYFSCKV